MNFYLLFTYISAHLLGNIAHSFDLFCSWNQAIVRKVRISEIWIRGRLTCFVDSAVRYQILANIESFEFLFCSKIKVLNSCYCFCPEELNLSERFHYLGDFLCEMKAPKRIFCLWEIIIHLGFESSNKR